MRAYIVIDLGFGDCGKGILTDFLVRRFNVGVVVRYNGGAQAGHNVIAPDGKHHTFSQFGSGTFVPGVKTCLSKHMVVHPTALLVEGGILERNGVRDAFSRIRISDQALIITPFHQAANHIREMARGENRHGSCGVGVGEAVEDALQYGEESILAGDLSNPAKLKQKLRFIREHKRQQLSGLFQDSIPEETLPEWELFERENIIDTWISAVLRISKLGLVVPDKEIQDWLKREEAVIFEGAQGVLLDADRGFHPYTTWSNCTAENAIDLLRECSPGAEVTKIGVLRSYAVRHGPGPLPTETEDLTSIVTDHNRGNPWQGKVRYGWFDAVLARYALEASGGVDALMVTHLDMLPRLREWRYGVGYNGLDSDDGRIRVERSGDIVTNFNLPHSLSLEQREQFTRELFKVKPVLETCEPDEGKAIEKIETLTGKPVGMVSRGPSARDVEMIK